MAATRTDSLNCPQCGSPLVFITTQHETHIYRCSRDGFVVVPPDGRIRVASPLESLGLLKQIDLVWPH
jgi:hypothetical protein